MTQGNLREIIREILDFLKQKDIQKKILERL